MQANYAHNINKSFQPQQLPYPLEVLNNPVVKLENEKEDFLLNAIHKLREANCPKNSESIIDLLTSILDKDFEKAAKQFSELDNESLALLPNDFGKDLLQRIAFHINNEAGHSLQNLSALFAILNTLFEKAFIKPQEFNQCLENLLQAEFLYGDINLESLNKILSTLKLINVKVSNQALFNHFYQELLKVAFNHLEKNLKGEMDDKAIRAFTDIFERMVESQFDEKRLDRIYRSLLRKVIHQQRPNQLDIISTLIVCNPQLIKNSQYSIFLLLKSLFEHALKEPNRPTFFIAPQNLIKLMCKEKLELSRECIVLAEFIIRAISQKLSSHKWGPCVDLLAKIKNIGITSKDELHKILNSLLKEIIKQDSPHFSPLYELCLPYLQKSDISLLEGEKKEQQSEVALNPPWWLEPSSTFLLSENINAFLKTPNEENLEHLITTLQNIKEPLSPELILSLLDCLSISLKDKRLFSEGCRLFLIVLDEKNLKEISPQKIHALCIEFTKNFPETKEYLSNDSFVRLIDFCLSRLSQPDEFIPFIELGKKFKNVPFLHTIWVNLLKRNFKESENQKLFRLMIKDMDFKRLRRFTAWKELTPNLTLSLAQKLILLGTDLTNAIDLPPLFEKGKKADTPNKFEFIKEVCEQARNSDGAAKKVNLDRAFSFFEDLDQKDMWYALARKQIIIALLSFNDPHSFKRALEIVKRASKSITEDEIGHVVKSLPAYPMEPIELMDILLSLLSWAKTKKLKKEILELISKNLSNKIPLSVLLNLSNALLEFTSEDIKSFNLPIIDQVLACFYQFSHENINTSLHLRHAHQNFGLMIIKLVDRFQNIINLKPFVIFDLESREQILALSKENDGALKEAVEKYFSDLIFSLPWNKVLDPLSIDKCRGHFGINEANSGILLDLWNILNEYDVSRMLDYADQLDFFKINEGYEKSKVHILHRFGLEFGILEKLYLFDKFKNAEVAVARLQKFADIVSLMKVFQFNTFEICASVVKTVSFQAFFATLEKKDIAIFHSYYNAYKKILSSAIRAEGGFKDHHIADELKGLILKDLMLLAIVLNYIQTKVKSEKNLKEILGDLLKNKDKLKEKIRQLLRASKMKHIITDDDIDQFYVQILPVLKYHNVDKFFSIDPRLLIAQMMRGIFKEIDFGKDNKFKEIISSKIQELETVESEKKDK